MRLRCLPFVAGRDIEYLEPELRAVSQDEVAIGREREGLGAGDFAGPENSRRNRPPGKSHTRMTGGFARSLAAEASAFPSGETATRWSYPASAITWSCRPLPASSLADGAVIAGGDDRATVGGVSDRVDHTLMRPVPGKPLAAVVALE